MKKTTNAIFMILFFNFLLFVISFEFNNFNYLRTMIVFLTFGYILGVWLYESFIDNKKDVSTTGVYLMLIFESFILGVSFLTETMDEFRAIVIGVPLLFYIVSWYIDDDKDKKGEKL